MRKTLLILPVLFILIQIKCELRAQFNLTAYQLQETLPQANVINPGFIPDSKVVVGLPGISGIYVSGSIPVRFSSIVGRRTDDSLQIDFDKLVNELGKKNDFSVNAQASLMYVGVRIKKGFLSFNARSLNEISLTFPKELAELAIYGNGAERLLGKNIDLSSLRSSSRSLISAGVGYAHTIMDDRLSFGMRLSLIKGIVSIETEKGSEITFRTNEQDYSIYMAGKNLSVNFAGFEIDSTGTEIPLGDSPVSYILNSQNTGFGLDFGADFRFNDRLRFSGAITDLGRVSWKTDVTNINVKDGSYAFAGLDLLDRDNASDDLMDTLEYIFDPDTTYNSYSTGLFTKFYVSANYQLARIHSVGAMIQGVMLKGRIRPAISLSYGIMLGRILNARVSYSVIGDSYNNVGLGFTANAGFFQLFAVTDNLIGLIYPQNVQYTNARLGINLTFGRKGINQ